MEQANCMHGFEADLDTDEPSHVKAATETRP
jgi:hypothetical protein